MLNRLISAFFEWIHRLAPSSDELTHLRVNTHDFLGYKLAFCMGINSGPVVAGLIGQKKFAYDLWGDAVNVASRMESHGVGN